MGILVFICSFFNFPNSEQLSMDYFWKDIVPKKYEMNEKFYFSGRTERFKSLTGPFSECYEDDEYFNNFFYNYKVAESESIEMSVSQDQEVVLTGKQRQATLFVEIFRAVSYNQYELIHIIVYKPNKFVHHYLIRLQDLDVVDYCFASEVI